MPAPFRIQVAPGILRWIRERAGLTPADLEGKFPEYAKWEAGELKPTFKKLEKLARVTHAPIGYFFLSDPLEETVSVPDFRTVVSERAGRLTVNLLDTIYLCQRRQNWFREFARMRGDPPLDFVASVSLASDKVRTAGAMRKTLGFNLEERRQFGSGRDEVLRRFKRSAESLGVLVMTSKVVGNNNNRQLDLEEFRGFALVDRFAPLVFINGYDSKAAQMFTLAHELAHIWLGESAISDVGLRSDPAHRVEVWCNQVAAELLVPFDSISREFSGTADLSREVQRLSRSYRVSTLVILRRLFDAGKINRVRFSEFYRDQVDSFREREALKAKRGQG